MNPHRHKPKIVSVKQHPRWLDQIMNEDTFNKYTNDYIISFTRGLRRPSSSSGRRKENRERVGSGLAEVWVGQYKDVLAKERRMTE